MVHAHDLRTIMTLVANETSQEYTFTRNGISLLVRHVPARVRRDLDGDEVRTFSMGVTDHAPGRIDRGCVG